MKWAFFYTLDDSADPTRIDRIGTLFGTDATAGLQRLFG